MPASLLLVDSERRPTVRLTWQTAEGPVTLEGTRPYAADAERTELGRNVTAYAAVGGTRLSKGAGHPRGAVVRVGFYKLDATRPFFENIAPHTAIEVEFTGVRFVSPPAPQPATIVQHLKFDPTAMQACGIPGDAREQFNTADETDTLNDRTRPGVDARLGVLDAESDDGAVSSLTLEDDGSVTLRVRFDYGLLRNLRDPWESDLPDTFLEPVHFHIEFECLPEGVEPLDRAAIAAEVAELRKKYAPQAPPLPDEGALTEPD